ncbi:hypothetical protein [Actinospica sp.]|uniref:hypothetical protein n=1 Tax=Actinospica sp. TaxID=1872142 RepID=UPI002D073500|nr:hypothetical protein [Actinospica sp.]HWG26498.1 hypothetical protein [Actinospica sp.]
MERLSLTLRDSYGHLEITGLREIGHGLDARVYRGESASLGPVAVRVPHARWLNNGRETQLDTRLQLRQDFELSRHRRAHGLPVPEVFAAHTSGTGVDFTIAQYVESDDSELPDREFGRLIRAIHEIPAPPFDLVCMESRDGADQVLAERIGDRLKNLAAVTELGVGFPDIGSLTPAALAGYGDPGSSTPPTPPTPLTPRQAVYGLDTTVMISHVFLDGAPDPAKARHYMSERRACAAG